MERIELARKIAKTSKLMFKVNAVISVLAAVFYVELMMRINGNEGAVVYFIEAAVMAIFNIYVWKLIKLISDKIKILQIFPFAYKLYKKEDNFEYRKFIVKNYVIIYKINLKEKEIKILHIYNQKLNYKKKPILL